jgi:integrase
MAIGKPRGKSQMRPVYVYDPRAGRKVYVGSRSKLRGPGGAEELERDKAQEFAGTERTDGKLTARAYSADWLTLHHGERTRRPSPTTKTVNQTNLRPFLDVYGDRLLDGGITRREALAWAKKHPHNAKVVSAMYNDALDDEVCKGNPFANRRQEQARGRKDIKPITEDEVQQLAQIGLEMWGAYGVVVAGWITFGAWVGCRPGETFGVTAQDLDFDAGLATIRRVKKRGNVQPTDVVVFPKVAQDAVRAIPDLPSSGPIFRTITGQPITKGAQRYVWDPIRKSFERTLSTQRRAELLDTRPDLDFYELRHFCGSMMADRGLSEHDIAHQLGNSVEVCRETYIHAYRDRTNERVRLALDGAGVVDLASKRNRVG